MKQYNGISIFHIKQLKNWNIYEQTAKGEWVPARSLGSTSIFTRLKAVFYVLSGKADVVLWDKEG